MWGRMEGSEPQDFRWLRSFGMWVKQDNVDKCKSKSQRKRHMPEKVFKILSVTLNESMKKGATYKHQSPQDISHPAPAPLPLV